MNNAEMTQKVKAIDEDRSREEFERHHLNSFVAIEPESGDSFLGRTLSKAAAPARAAHPDRRSLWQKNKLVIYSRASQLPERVKQK